MTLFLMGMLAVPVGAAAMLATWWLIGKAIGLLRFPVLGFITLHRPEKIIGLLEDSRRSRAFRFTVPGLAILVIADRKDKEAGQ